MTDRCAGRWPCWSVCGMKVSGGGYDSVGGGDGVGVGPQGWKPSH